MDGFSKRGMSNSQSANRGRDSLNDGKGNLGIPYNQSVSMIGGNDRAS